VLLLLLWQEGTRQGTALAVGVARVDAAWLLHFRGGHRANIDLARRLWTTMAARDEGERLVDVQRYYGILAIRTSLSSTHPCAPAHQRTLDAPSCIGHVCALLPQGSLEVQFDGHRSKSPIPT
jgi:hypothetical protein